MSTTSPRPASPDDTEDVVQEESQQIALTLLVVVAILLASTLTIYIVKKLYIRVVSAPTISLTYGALPLTRYPSCVTLHAFPLMRFP